MKKFNLGPQIWKYLISRFAGVFGSSMLSFALGLYVLRQTGSALGMGITLITGPLVSLVLTPFVGYVVDTMSHRKIVIVGQLASMLALLAFGIVISVWPEQYYIEIISLMVILQVTDNFFGTALQSSMISLFEGAELQRVNGLAQSLNATASFLAPIIGAVVYTLVSIGSFAFIELGFELIALAGVMMLNFDAQRVTNAEPETDVAAEQEEHESIWQNFKVGFGYIRTQKLLLFVISVSTLINFFFAAINVGQPFILVDSLRLSNGQYGMTESAFAIGMVLGGVLFSAMNLKKHFVLVSFKNIIIVSILLGIIGVPLLFNWSSNVNTIFYVAFNMLIGTILVFVNSPVGIYMQANIDPKFQGRVFSIMSTLSMLLMPIGTLFYGVLFDHLNGAVIFAVTGLILLLIVSTALVAVAKLKLIEQDEAQHAEIDKAEAVPSETAVN